MKNLNKLKFLKAIIAVMFVVVMSQSFTACKDDNDEELDNNSLNGTSWIITEISDPDEEELIGVRMTFNSDGSVSFFPWQTWTYAKWGQDGEILQIVLGEDEPDDYMMGKFIIKGNSATYTYSYYDVDEKWGGEETYIMKLQKK